MQAYASYYITGNVNILQYCEVLRQYYATFLHDNFKEGTWLIEQAPGLNCSGLHAIAEVVTDNTLSYSVMARIFQADASLRKVCQGMWAVIQGPFINIKEPVIPLRQYANIAYACIRLLYGPTYITSSLGGMCKKKDSIDSVVNMIANSTRTGEGGHLLGSALQEAYPDANIVLGNNQLLGYQSLKPASEIQAGPEVVEPNLRTNPNAQAVGVSPISANRIIAKFRNGHDIAFTKLCNLFLEATTQKALDPSTLEKFCTRPPPLSMSEADLTLLELTAFTDSIDYTKAVDSLAAKWGEIMSD